jgi:nucleoside-diphosphate-sugar epimerase
MHVFVAGATGALGLPLLRRLAAAGHTVTGLTRSADRRGLMAAAGARAAVGDALDRQALAEVVREASPSHIVNLLTALPPEGARRPKDLRPTNELRVRGTAHLLAAALDAGVKRLVAESFIAVFGRPEAGRPLREEDPLGEVPPRDALRETVLALRSLEEQLAGARRCGWIETVALRYGFFYGPQVPSTQALLRSLRRGRLFIPKKMGGIGSWIHIEDAASATLAALEHPAPDAVYHVADDEPMSLHDALAHAAAALGAPAPRSMPAWLLRWAAPVMASTASARLPLNNAKAKRELDWQPAYPNLASGFAHLAQRAQGPS